MSTIVKRIRNLVILLGTLAVAGFLLVHMPEVSSNDAQTTGSAGNEIEGTETASETESSEANDSEASETVREAGYAAVYLRMEHSQTEKEIALYLDDTDAYFFLPSYSANDCGLYWSYDESVCQIRLNGRALHDGDSIETSALSDSYKLELSEYSEETDAWESGFYQLTFLQSENLPCIYVDTYNGTMDYVNAQKGNKEPGQLTCVLADGSVDTECDFESIHFRGASSAAALKKTYKVHFSESVDLLSMGSGTSWILQANAYDNSKLRNKICYELAQSLGLPGAVSATYADIYFNGEYGGNYLIVEPVEVAENRLDISEDSVLLECNVLERLTEDALYITDEYNALFEIRYPEAVTEETQKKIRNRLVKIEDLLDQCEDDASYRQLTKYVDMDSLAAAYLMGQLCNEVDQNVLSTFYYFDGSDGKLYAGSAWDYDRSFGSDGVAGSLRTRYVAFNSFPSGFPEQLSNNESFMELVRAKLEETMDVISGLSASVPARMEEISSSLDMDSILWNTVYQEDTAYLEWNIDERVTLILDTIENPELYHRVYIDNARTGRFYWARDGETLSSSVISCICSLYGCTSLVSEGGVTMWDGYPIFADMVLSTVGSTVTTETDQGSDQTAAADSGNPEISADTGTNISISGREFLGMNILIFIIFVVPGLITMYLTGELQTITKTNAGLRIVQYLIYEFLIMLFTYGVITLVKGNITMSLSLESVGAAYTIYNVNVVFGVMAVELVGACLLGRGKLLWRKHRN